MNLLSTMLFYFDKTWEAQENNPEVFCLLFLSYQLCFDSQKQVHLHLKHLHKQIMN